MKIYTVFFAEDVPHYGTTEITAANHEEAIAAGTHERPHVSAPPFRSPSYTNMCILVSMEAAPKLVRWIGSSRKDLKNFPKLVQRHIGQALWAAQRGEEYPTVKALKGFGGRAVLEIVAPHETDT